VTRQVGQLARLAVGGQVRPSSVTARWWVVRSNRRVPNRVSNWAMSLATDAGVTPICRAAPEKLPARCTAAATFSPCKRSMLVFPIR
jgi:hypothetical protein